MISAPGGNRRFQACVIYIGLGQAGGRNLIICNVEFVDEFPSVMGAVKVNR